MRKLILTLAGIVGLVAVFIIFNQFDPSPSKPPFPPEDIPPADFGSGNGFYIQWGLSEPLEVDITSPALHATYRRLHDPTKGNDPSFQWDHAKYRENYRTYFQPEYNKLRLSSAVHNAQHMIRKVKNAGQRLKNLHPNLRVLLQRYRTMIDAPYYADFTSLSIDAPIPNLLAWLQSGILYTSYNLSRALNGDWTSGASNILDQIDFGKRAIKGSRCLINNLIAKATTSIAIQALGGLINVKECPPEVFEMIISRTPPLQYEEYGTRASLLCEYLGYKDQLEQWKYISEDFYPFEKYLLKLLTQKNRTLNMIQQEISKVIRFEMVPPFQWGQGMPDTPKAASGAFWWIQNPGGKILFDRHFPPTHFKAVVLKSFRLKTYYQMLRISAQLHLRYKPEKSVRDVLKEIPAVWITDPCSGKPYIWDETKQILYSIGTDRKDDGGMLQEDTVYGDFALPVILYVHGN